MSFFRFKPFQFSPWSWFLRHSFVFLTLRRILFISLSGIVLRRFFLYCPAMSAGLSAAVFLTSISLSSRIVNRTLADSVACHLAALRCRSVDISVYRNLNFRRERWQIWSLEFAWEKFMSTSASPFFWICSTSILLSFQSDHAKLVHFSQNHHPASLLPPLHSDSNELKGIDA